MRFTKMHGIGNDYVYVNAFDQTVEEPASLARRISDRHCGVGGDGLILLLPPDPAGPGPADLRMRMFNADGSEAEMCGNGIRCLCKLAHDHDICTANPMRIQTGGGLYRIQYTTNGNGKVDQITVDMGQPIFEPARIPVLIDELDQIVNHSIQSLIDWNGLPNGWMEQCGLNRRMTCVSMGNPHAVLFCDLVQQVPLAQAGRIIEHHQVFPNRINVHFAQVDSRAQITMRTWERGSGATLACGTGAAAVCVAGVLTDHTDRRILVHLPGGDLHLEWKEGGPDDNHVFMTGPATEVFSGKWAEGT